MFQLAQNSKFFRGAGDDDDDEDLEEFEEQDMVVAGTEPTAEDIIQSDDDEVIMFEQSDDQCQPTTTEDEVQSLGVGGPEPNGSSTHYLDINELIMEDIIWLDDVEDLLSATLHLEECEVVGIDCEWKPNYVKGSKPKKLLTSYNWQCDLRHLVHSYDDMQSFKRYEMGPDIQNVFKETSGGLSGLAQKILAAGLNKTRQTSNWEQRPLTHNQALDAVVLVHIFRHVRDQVHHTASINDDEGKVDWKSYIVSSKDICMR